MKKILPLLIVGILVLSGLGAVAITDDTTYDVKVAEESIVVSEPIIKESGQYVTVSLDEETSSILEVGKPMLPVVTKVFTFPFGTKISHVEVSFSEVKELVLSKEVQPVPERVPINVGVKVVSKPVKDTTVYENNELYPSSEYSYITRSGLDDGKHVVFLIVNCYFTRYSPTQNIIYYSTSADIEVFYEEPTNPMVFDDVYDLVIISPSEFSGELQPLLTHKNNFGVETIIKTTEDIYAEYEGFDEAEEIKYFIKDTIENWGADYILLVGSIDKLPIRTTYGSWWGEGDILCDLYYSDIYNDTGGFCSWDGNNNGRFGEIYHDQQQVYDLDDVDLYPDINLGRLACVDKNEVSMVVDKIINYETSTYGKSWFNNIILCGGDTFPFRGGNEGEILNNMIEEIMPDFTPTKLWTSDKSFNSINLNIAINKGAGFVDYSGHGIENGMGTHPPNRNSWIMYYTSNLVGLFNGYELPIVFFDACLTARLDYDGSNSNYNSMSSFKIINLLLQKGIFKPLFRILNSLISDYNPKSAIKMSQPSFPQTNPKPFADLTPCFAWNWVREDNGGGIATIGATRLAYGGYDSGAGKMSLEFFSAYENSETLGQMMTQAQNGYITDVPQDFLTIEEFILLGDPSLKIGGYP